MALSVGCPVARSGPTVYLRDPAGGWRTLCRGPHSWGVAMLPSLGSLVNGLLQGTGVTVDGGRPWDITVNRERFYRRALRGSLGIGESYVDGDWDCPTLDELFRRVLSA